MFQDLSTKQRQPTTPLLPVYPSSISSLAPPPASQPAKKKTQGTQKENARRARSSRGTSTTIQKALVVCHETIQSIPKLAAIIAYPYTAHHSKYRLHHIYHGAKRVRSSGKPLPLLLERGSIMKAIQCTTKNYRAIESQQRQAGDPSSRLMVGRCIAVSFFLEQTSKKGQTGVWNEEHGERLGTCAPAREEGKRSRKMVIAISPR